MPDDPVTTELEAIRAEQELLPCPFDGATAQLREWDWPYERWQVRCSQCKATPGGRKNTREKAIKAWNTRHA